ncbi:MAG: glycosyltransferase family 39 protein [Patescibacteria group bacterium]|nr:glycosyltransferase family 39 protein [Patescibacteria group bacterium]
MGFRFWRRKEEKCGLYGRTGFWLAGIVALAALLRLINIAKEPFWGDEILSLDIATSFGSMAEMLRYIAQVEFHPPLYYIILRPWTMLFGTSEVAVRSLSLLSSIGIVLLVYVLAKRMFDDRRVGLIAAGITAILPLQIEFGQEARPYALFCLLGCVAALSVWEYLQTRRRAWAYVYFFATVVGLYLHYSYSFIAIATALWWVMAVASPAKERGQLLFKWFAVHAAIFVAFWPWLDEFLYKIFLGGFDIIGLKRNLVPIREPNFFGDLFDSVIWVTKDEYVPAIQNLAVALAVGVFIWMAVRLIRGKREAGSGKPFAALVTLTVTPAILFLFAPQSIPYTTLVERHMIWLTVPLTIAIAAVVVRSGKRRGAMLLAVFVASLLPYIVGIVGNDAYFDHDFRLEEGAEYINEHYVEGDVVIVAANILRSDFAHYLREDIPMETLIPVQFRGEDVWRGRHVLGLIENEIQVRIPQTSREEVFAKFDWITEKHSPQRIWVYGLTQRDFKAHDWFEERDWRRSFWSVSDILRLDMYIKR